jgi:hypothetical protein
MILSLAATSSLVKGGHRPNHERPCIATCFVKCPVLTGFEAVFQHLATGFCEQHDLSFLAQPKKSKFIFQSIWLAATRGLR